VKTEQETASRYQWVILGLVWLILVCGDVAVVIAGPLAHVLIPDVKLTLQQFVSLTTFAFLGGGVFALVGGSLGDRIGVNKVIAIGQITLGLFWALRALGIGYYFLLACTFIGGAGVGLVLPNLPKVIATWFARTKVGLATGIYGTGFWIGMALGLAVAVPWFGSNWSLAYLVTGVANLACGILWVFFSREAPSRTGVPEAQFSLLSALKQVVKLRNLWISGFMLMLAISTISVFIAFIPTSLVTIHKIVPATAGYAVSLAMIGMAVGSYVIPMLSDKLGFRKPFLIVSGILWGIGVFFAWLVAPHSAIWPLLFLAGFGVGAGYSSCLVLPIEAPGIRPEIMATGSALVVVVGYITAGFLPTYGVASIAALSATWAYVALLAFGLIYALAAGFFLIESGPRVKAKI
jgi:cyanate permease